MKLTTSSRVRYQREAYELDPQGMGFRRPGSWAFAAQRALDLLEDLFR